MSNRNLHGTAVVFGDCGVLIIGKSGSGKTSLALALLEQARARNLFARLVGDDQLFFSETNGRLIVETPGAITGLVEVRGLGPRSIATQDRAVIDMVAELVPAAAAGRFQEIERHVIGQASVPKITLQEKQTTAAATAILAEIGVAPFPQRTVHMRQNG